MMQYLSEVSLEHIHQHTIDFGTGSWLYDFYVPELHLLLETDGEYWHTKTLERINQDRLKQETAWTNGYNFLRISDHDWRPELVFACPDAQREHSENMVRSRQSVFEQIREIGTD
jgi:very-short-patch-repair endonuclease